MTDVEPLQVSAVSLKYYRSLASLSVDENPANVVNHDVSLIPVCRSEISMVGSSRKMIGGKEAKEAKEAKMGPHQTGWHQVATSGMGQITGKEWA